MSGFICIGVDYERLQNRIAQELSTTDAKDMEQGNSVTRDLPPTGSEANTTIYFFKVGSRFIAQS